MTIPYRVFEPRMEKPGRGQMSSGTRPWLMDQWKTFGQTRHRLKHKQPQQGEGNLRRIEA